MKYFIFTLTNEWGYDILKGNFHLAYNHLKLFSVLAITKAKFLLFLNNFDFYMSCMG